jgi:hypothetical protein
LFASPFGFSRSRLTLRPSVSIKGHGTITMVEKTGSEIDKGNTNGQIKFIECQFLASLL